MTPLHKLYEDLANRFHLVKADNDRLRKAIRQHRHVWDHYKTVQLRHNANDDLWAVLEDEEQ